MNFSASHAIRWSVHLRHRHVRRDQRSEGCTFFFMSDLRSPSGLAAPAALSRLRMYRTRAGNGLCPSGSLRPRSALCPRAETHSGRTIDHPPRYGTPRLEKCRARGKGQHPRVVPTRRVRVSRRQHNRSYLFESVCFHGKRSHDSSKLVIMLPRWTPVLVTLCFHRELPLEDLALSI